MSLIEKFCCFQVCNLNSWTQQGYTLSVNLPTGDSWQKLCGHLVKVRIFHFQTHLERLFGYQFSLYHSQFLVQANEFSE